MMGIKKMLYFCTKCSKTSREPISECPICGNKTIGRRPIVEVKNLRKSQYRG
jgi:rRNA maturation endonuclease Nob1